MRKIRLSEYLATPKDYRGIWNTERWDLPGWKEVREKYMGKRTIMVYENGTCLLVEGLSFEIVDDTDWKKPETVRKDISRHYLKFFSERGFEPHYADCIIRWKDDYNTEEVRIALSMDATTEKDVDIFFYCDTLEDMKSLAEIGSEDFCIANCYGFGIYEDLL